MGEDPQSHRQSGMPDTEDNVPDEPELLEYRTGDNELAELPVEAVDENKEFGVPDEELGEHQI